jgi:integrase/recombinase XerD
MSNDHSILIAQLRESLIQQRYNASLASNYCHNAVNFLHYLDRRKIAIEAATPTDVSNYLHCAIRWFRQRHGHSPCPQWESRPRSSIHALLRLVQKQWPPEPVASNPGEVLCRAVCKEYREWLIEQRGLAVATVYALMWEARHFMSWYTERTGGPLFKELGIGDIDAYFKMRAVGLRRRSLKDVAERLRSLTRYLHNTGRTAIDLSQQIIMPRLYAYETIPSVLSPEQIAAVLKCTQEDKSPLGLRDFAILQLLSTYGLRIGEIRRLRLDDINWREETLCIRQSKTGASSLLPLMPPVGEALIDYLRGGRPKTNAREIFIRARAPYRPLLCLYSNLRRRLEAANISLPGKRGPHIFRHAHAVSLLRSSVPMKIIGDLLGHRSTDATIPYLKLATEDLRAIALEIPGKGVRL